MNKTRKTVALLLTVLMILSVFSGTGITAFAEETDITDYLTYEYKSTSLYGDGISITGCDTSVSGDIVIPGSIDGEPVVYLDENAFRDCDKITSVVIPDSVRLINNNAFPYTCSNLREVTIGAGVSILPSFGAHVERIFISENNKYFSSDEYGVVYNKDKTQLVRYSTYNPQTVYTLPASVTSILSTTLSFGKNLAFISVEDGNTVYSNDEYGVLYNADKTELVKCPKNYVYSDYEIPDGVLSASDGAFSGCSKLEKVILGKDMTAVSDTMFISCSSLTEIVMHDNIQSIGSYAFGYCKKLDCITIPDKVTTIGDSAFVDCTALTEINLQEKIQSIGDSAFMGCTALTSVHLPESITEIEDYAFKNCTSLTEVTMGKNVTAIGKYLFSGCSALEAVELPEGIKAIPDYAFYYCSALESVSIPDSVETIGMAAFYGCSIKELDLPESLTAFGLYYTFSNNDFTSVDIPDGVSEIPNYCFSGCDKLKDVFIPEGVTSIAEAAFKSCSSIEEIVIPASTEAIGVSAFSGCAGLKDISILNPDCVIYDSQYTISATAVIHGHPGSTAEEYAAKYSRTFVALGENNYEIFESFTYEVKDNAVTIISCDKEAAGEIVIPEVIGEYPVTAIGEGAFDGCVNVTAVTFNDVSVVISDSETTIPENITINGYKGSTAEGYATKYSRTFVSLDNAEVIEHLKYVISDGEVIIRGYQSTLSGHIVLPDTIEGYPVTTIAYSAFNGCEALTGIVIPESITDIKGLAFNNCINLETAVLPENIKNLNKGLFSGCLALKTLRLPEGLTLIDERAFYYCAGLEYIEIPASVTTIGEYAFYSCQNLTSVKFNEGLQEIGPDAFVNAYSLTEVVIPDSVTKIGASAFRTNRALTKVVIGKGLAELGDKAFLYCGNIESFTVDENNEYFSTDKCGVLFNKNKTRLIQYPGKSSRLSYEIPDSVTELDSYAFYNTENLENVTLSDGIKTLSPNLFYGSRIEKIIIPEGVETIGQQAFSSCYYLKNVQLPESVSLIEKDAFAYCNKITAMSFPNSECVIYDSEYTIYSKTVISGYAGSTAEEYATKYNRQFEEIPLTGVADNFSYTIVNGSAVINGFDEIPMGSVFIPAEIEGVPVTGINPSMFAGNVSITTVVFPETITTIEADAFRGCTLLKKVVATNVESIGKNAFALCKTLDTVVTFAESVSVAENAFDEEASLTVFVREDAELASPETVNVITFSFKNGVLGFKGNYKSDLYYLFDLVTVMCAYYDNIEYLFFESFEVVSADDGHIYYYTKEWQRMEFDGTSASNVRFSVEAFNGEDFEHLTFNELCEKVAADELSNFNLVIEEADGLDSGNIEISIVEEFNTAFQRILKALTNLINKLFAFFKKLGV